MILITREILSSFSDLILQRSPDHNKMKDFFISGWETSRQPGARRCRQMYWREMWGGGVRVVGGFQEEINIELVTSVIIVIMLFFRSLITGTTAWKEQELEPEDLNYRRRWKEMTVIRGLCSGDLWDLSEWNTNISWSISTPRAGERLCSFPEETPPPSDTGPITPTQLEEDGAIMSRCFLVYYYINHRNKNCQIQFYSI